jgi:hypothetical protein
MNKWDLYVGDQLLSGPEDAFVAITSEPPGQPFLFEGDGRKIEGTAVVAEVAPCIFVFVVFVPPMKVFPSHSVTMCIKADAAESLAVLRSKTVEPTPRHVEAYANYVRLYPDVTAVRAAQG